MTVALAKRNPLRCSLSCGDPQRDAFPCRSVWSIGSSAHTALASDTYIKSYSLMQAVEIVECTRAFCLLKPKLPTGWKTGKCLPINMLK